jgi:ABC-type phosphonate transport system ATPase subunit
MANIMANLPEIVGTEIMNQQNQQIQQEYAAQQAEQQRQQQMQESQMQTQTQLAQESQKAEIAEKSSAADHNRAMTVNERSHAQNLQLESVKALTSMEIEKQRAKNKPKAAKAGGK